MCHAAVRVNSISIHSLHTEGDHVIFCTLFLCFMYFNPLPPHGGRPSVTSLFVLPGVISIHSLRMEGDRRNGVRRRRRQAISIHSLRMEGDCL